MKCHQAESLIFLVFFSSVGSVVQLIVDDLFHLGGLFIHLAGQYGMEELLNYLKDPISTWID